MQIKQQKKTIMVKHMNLILFLAHFITNVKLDACSATENDRTALSTDLASLLDLADHFPSARVNCCKRLSFCRVSEFIVDKNLQIKRRKENKVWSLHLFTLTTRISGVIERLCTAVF